MYSNNRVPFTVMDGRLGNFDVNYSGLSTDISTVTIDRRALTEPEFDISIVMDPLSTATDSINLSVSLNSNFDYPDPVIVQAALVDDGINSSPIMRNVFKKGLFGREGYTITDPWIANTTQKSLVAKNSIDVSVSRPDSLAVIAYVFDKKTRIILQSTYLKLGNKTQTIITGINGEPATLKLYPNPSPGVSYLSSSAANGGTWQLIDQRGVIVLRGELRKGSEWNPSEINVSGISNGLYIMKVVQDGGQVAYEKLIINNQK
jgi:hypothetical protein